MSLRPDSTSYSDTTIAGSTLYRYRVVATGAVGDSQPSNSSLGRGGLFNPYQRIEAESAEEFGGCYPVGNHVEAMGGYDWIHYFGVDFGASGAGTFSANIAVPSLEAGQFIEIHLDSPDGPLVGQLKTVPTVVIDLNRRNAKAKYDAAWSVYAVQSTTLFAATTGIHDVYLVGRGSRPMGLGNVDWIEFTPASSGMASSVSATTLTQPRATTTANKKDRAISQLDPIANGIA